MNVRLTTTTLADGRELLYFDDSEPYLSGAATRELHDARPLVDRFAPVPDADGIPQPVTGPAHERLASKPGSSVGRPGASGATAPPCTRRTSPARASSAMSRRTVMSETSRLSTRSATRAAPWARTATRIRS